MGDISKHFSRFEFACRCGCGFDTVDVELIVLAEEVREINGRPITPNSGCRCIAHNNAIGGSPNSQHLLGKAGDFPVDAPERVYRELCRRHPYRYGFFLYKTFIHADSRDNPARGDYR